MDTLKLSDQLLALGILLPDSAIGTIFSQLGGKNGGTLDIPAFLKNIEEATDDPSSENRHTRHEITAFSAKGDCSAL